MEGEDEGMDRDVGEVGGSSVSDEQTERERDEDHDDEFHVSQRRDVPGAGASGRTPVCVRQQHVRTGTDGDCPPVRDDRVVRRWRWPLVGSLLIYAAGVAGILAVGLSTSGGAPDFSVPIVSGFVVALGLVVAWRRPESPVAAPLVLLGAAPSLVSAIEAWGASYGSTDQMTAARFVGYVSPGVWVFNFAGFVMLCATFPTGLLAGRGWRVLPWAFCCVALMVVGVVAIQPEQFAAGGGPLPGATPLDLPAAVNTALVLLVAALLVAVLAGAVTSVVVRYRSGDELTQVQLRWFMLAAGSVPVLLVAGWVANSVGASQAVAYTPFMTGILVGLPSAVAVAILRHDLLDIDRLLNGTISWVLTTVGSAAVFALVVVGIAQSSISRTGIGEGVGLAVGAFVTALVLTPLHRWFQVAVGRLLDRDRVIVLAEIRRFVDQVRDGQAEPEDVEDVLRDCLDDPGLLVLLRVPGRDGFTRLDGESAEIADDGRSISLESRGAEIGLLRLGQTSVRRVRRAREAAVEARLAIDVSRLRLELRQALDDARSSRLRLVEAAATERLRLERDLHDGAQQQIVAVGMRLRSVQRRHPVDDPTHDELDLAVNTLESIVDELRRLAHGMRPGMLDDGLEVALRSLVTNSPVPVQVEVDETNASEVAVTTAYFVVAEALANALKHADASCVHVRVGSIDGRLDVEVRDDGNGRAGTGFGLTALQDRVAALDGRFTIESVPGQGTRIRAML